MLIARSPLRITLGGGGTDLPSYYSKHGGFLLSAAIDKYVYITLHQSFDEDFIIKYSQLERVRHIDEVQHPIIREACRITDTDIRYLEMTSMSDIPAGTGLGSSGSFTSALLYALHMLDHRTIQKQDLAEQACRIEIDILKEPIGKQDQYIATFGGVTAFQFEQDGKVTVEPVKMSAETLANLEDNLVLFFTGYTRAAATILQDQDSRTKNKDRAMVDNLHRIKELAYESREAFQQGNLRRFAELMHAHWELKRGRSQGMANDRIDQWYALAREHGALGGKLVGAGSGGFLMFYTEDKTRLRRAMRAAGLGELRFKFDFEGTTTVVSQS
jgi:D-glycero-alpha-D-manno-heptose-7-phosphate kinase